MFARVEVAVRPEFSDPAAEAILRRVELAHPDLRRLIRWARFLQVYWLEIDCTREKLIGAVSEIFWDKVLTWLFTATA